MTEAGTQVALSARVGVGTERIVFDQMLPRIANDWTKNEVEALMRGAGLEAIELAWVKVISWPHMALG